MPITPCPVTGLSDTLMLAVRDTPCAACMPGPVFCAIPVRSLPVPGGLLPLPGRTPPVPGGPPALLPNAPLLPGLITANNQTQTVKNVTPTFTRYALLLHFSSHQSETPKIGQIVRHNMSHSGNTNTPFSYNSIPVASLSSTPNIINWAAVTFQTRYS
jgi:hypothetical protein